MLVRCDQDPEGGECTGGHGAPISVGGLGLADGPRTLGIYLGWGSCLECFPQVCASSPHRGPPARAVRAGGALRSSPSGVGGTAVQSQRSDSQRLQPPEVGVSPANNSVVPAGACLELDSDTSCGSVRVPLGKCSVPQGSSHSDAHEKARVSRAPGRWAVNGRVPRPLLQSLAAGWSSPCLLRR